MKCCPKCGSKEIKYLPWLGEIYECKDCGYQGALIVEDGELAREIRKNAQNSEKKEQEGYIDKKGKEQ